MAKMFTFALLFVSLQFAVAQDLLKMASTGYDYEKFKNALRSVADVNQIRDDNGETLLHLAAANSHQEGVGLLLFAGANVNAKDSLGWTPIFSALSSPGDHPKGDDAFMILEMLTLMGADVNVVANDGMTPLAVAVQTGNVRAAEFLLWRGAALAPAGVGGDQMPLSIARAKGNQPMIALLEAAANLPAMSAKSSDKHLAESLTRRFSSATQAADLNAVEALLATGVSINQQDENGKTALYRAADDKRPDLVTLLLLEGANPNLATINARTPLMAAAKWFGLSGQRMTMLLLLSGADVNAVNNEGLTALSQAVVARNDFDAQWFVWRGADLNFRTPKGSIMQLAESRPDWPSMIELLKSFGLKDEKPTNREPHAELFDAVRLNDKAAVERELQKGVPVTVTDELGRPLLFWAATMGNFDIVDLLMKRGADINEPNCNSGWTAFHTIAGARGGDDSFTIKSMKELLKRGGNPNAVAKDGMTPLMLAARRGVDIDRINLLIQSRALVNVRDKSGKTALAQAREFGHQDVVKLLVAHGATE